MNGSEGSPGRPSARPSAGRRWAAAGALAALLAAVAVVIIGLLRDPIRLVAVVLLLVLVMLAAWTALVHRGPRRVLAATVAVAALAGVVVLVVFGSPARLLVLIGLIALSTAAGRVALGPAPDEIGWRSVAPARSGVLLMNPWSGGGKVGRFDLVDEATSRGIAPVVLQRGDDLRALAEKAVAAGADVIGMAGGDGSQALVADVARQHDCSSSACRPEPATISPSISASTGRRRRRPRRLRDGARAPGRPGRGGGRMFVNNASIGAYATIVQDDAYRDAKLATVVEKLPDLLGPGGRRVDLSVPGADGAGGLLPTSCSSPTTPTG